MTETKSAETKPEPEPPTKEEALLDSAGERVAAIQKELVEAGVTGSFSFESVYGSFTLRPRVSNVRVVRRSGDSKSGETPA